MILFTQSNVSKSLICLLNHSRLVNSRVSCAPAVLSESRKEELARPVQCSLGSSAAVAAEHYRLSVLL